MEFYGILGVFKPRILQLNSFLFYFREKYQLSSTALVKMSTQAWMPNTQPPPGHPWLDEDQHLSSFDENDDEFQAQPPEGHPYWKKMEAKYGKATEEKKDEPEKKQEAKKDVICYSCNEKGHYSTACPNRKRPAPKVSFFCFFVFVYLYL